ncbi:MAG: hypothetical protein AB7V32_09240, partial [Candidatus Berkiella sp.]
NKVMQFCCLITAIGMTGIGFSCLPISLKENFIPFFQELVAIVHGQEVKDCDLGEAQGLKERKEGIYSAAFELALSLGHDSVAAKLLTDKQNGLVSFNETPHMNFKQLLSQQHYSIIALLLMLYRKKSLEDFSSTLRSLQLDGFDFNEHSKLVFEHLRRFLECNNQDPANTLRLLECAASLGCLDEASAIASTLESDSALDIQHIYNFAFEMACSRDDLSMAQKLLPCVLAQLKQNPVGNHDWVLRCGFSENVCPVVLELAQRCGQLDAVLEHAINTQDTSLLSKLLCTYSKHIPAHVIEKAIYTAIDLPGLRIDTLGTLLYHTCKHMSAVAFDEFIEYAQNHNPFIPMCLENYKRVREHEEAIPHVYVPAYHQGRKRVRQSEVKELQKEAEEFKRKRDTP